MDIRRIRLLFIQTSLRNGDMIQSNTGRDTVLILLWSFCVLVKAYNPCMLEQIVHYGILHPNLMWPHSVRNFLLPFPILPSDPVVPSPPPIPTRTSSQQKHKTTEPLCLVPTVWYLQLQPLLWGPMKQTPPQKTLFLEDIQLLPHFKHCPFKWGS